jgi:uncharacterized protein (TIGR03435 family)
VPRVYANSPRYTARDLARLVLFVALAAIVQPLPLRLASQTLTFDVVSIKRSAPGAPPGSGGVQPGGRYRLANGPARILIGVAYPAVEEIIGAPDWVTYENYDVTAIAGANATEDDIAAMMRSMLAQRFKLQARIEQRERPVYALTLARRDGTLGPNLRSSRCTDAAAGKTPCIARFGRGSITAGGFSMEWLAVNLRGGAGRPVVDRTGLTGGYDFTLEYAAGAPALDTAPDGKPSLFTALQEQLGLKLEPAQALLPVIVVERIERPLPD